MPYPIGLTQIQWSREATPGTDLATTSKLLCTSFSAKPMSERYVPEVLRGLMQRNRGFETVMKHWTEFDFGGPVSYEQLQNLLCSAMGINVTSPTGLSPYVWTFTKNPAVVPTPCTFTIERDEYDGSTHIGQAWHYVVITELTISFAEGQPLMFAAKAFGRRVQTETITAAQSLPTPEIPPTALASVYIDTTFAGLGGTQVASQVLAASVTIKNGAVPLWTLDARSDLDFTTIGYDVKDIQINASVTAYLGGQYATEKTAAEAQSLRALHLAIAGTSSRALTLGGIFKYATPGLHDFGENNGQRTVLMNLEESSDGTNLFKAVLTNLVSAFA